MQVLFENVSKYFDVFNKYKMQVLFENVSKYFGSI